jgi:hypothetical protein
MTPTTEVKLAELEREVLPYVATATLMRLADTVVDCRISAELHQRLTTLAAWAKGRATDEKTIDALEEVTGWSRAKAQELDWILAQRKQRRPEE